MNTVRLCPREPTFHNGQRVDPVDGLEVPKSEAEYLEARGWRSKSVVDAARAARAKADAEAQAAFEKKVRDELAKIEKVTAKRGTKKGGAA